MSFSCNYFLLTKAIVLPTPGPRDSYSPTSKGDSGMKGNLYVSDKYLAKSRSVGCPWEAAYVMSKVWHCWISKAGRQLHVSRDRVADGLPK